MSKTNRRDGLLVGVTVLAALQAEGAWAADSGESREQDRGLEEVVVTARKTQENLQRVPVAVTALSGDQMEARAMADLKDIGRFTPNVYFSNIGSASPHQAAVFIRGVGQAEAMITGDAGVGLYVDGVYYGRSQGGILDLLDLERVEVLRGPQGTLFGKNTIGGAINMTSRAPEGDGSGNLSLTVGNYDRIDISGSADIGLSDNLALKVSGLSKSRDCLFVRPSDRACYGDLGTVTGRGYLRYTPSSDFTADFIVDATRSRQHSLPHRMLAYNEDAAVVQDYNNRVLAGTAPGPLLLNSTMPANVTGNTYATEGNLPTAATLNSSGASLHLQYVLGNVTLHSISAYRDVDARSTENSDGSNAELAEVPSYTEAEQWTQELRADGSLFDQRVQYVAGVYYFREEGSTFESVLIPYVFDAFFGSGGWSQDNRQTATSYAGFLHTSTELVEDLRLSADVRYTKDKKSFTGGRKSFLASTYDQVPLTNTKVEWDVWTPKFGLDYQLTDAVLVYTSASRGYRSGGFNGRSESLFSMTTPYDPEYVWTYELGTKTQLFDDRVRLNLAAFKSDYTDRQQTILRVIPNTTTFAPVVANAAKVSIEGLEAELTAILTPQLRVEANVGYTDAKFDSISPEVTDITLDSVVTFVPEWTGAAAIEYTVPMSALKGDVSARVDYSYRDKVTFSPTATDFNTQDAIGLVNARLSYVRDDGTWELSAYGRNLTDKRYKLWANDLYDTPFGLAFAWFSDPREYGITIKRRF